MVNANKNDNDGNNHYSEGARARVCLPLRVQKSWSPWWQLHLLAFGTREKTRRLPRTTREGTFSEGPLRLDRLLQGRWGLSHWIPVLGLGNKGLL